MYIQWYIQFSSVTQSCLTLLRPHGLQHSRPPCPSPTPRVYPNSCPLSQWCHPTISSSVVPSSSCLQSLTMVYYSAIKKKKEIMPFVATWMDLEIDMLNQTNKNIIWYHPYVESDFLNDTNQLIYKIETFPDIKNKHMIPKVGECGREG